MKAEKKISSQVECPVTASMTVLGGKWKPIIVFILSMDKRRFSEIERMIPSATRKTLTVQLRELEKDGIVKREIFPEVPPRVEYSLTELGNTLRPAMKALCDWGATHILKKEFVYQIDHNIGLMK
jgi:DNA-binding HxlR family transcriptional regulator